MPKNDLYLYDLHKPCIADITARLISERMRIRRAILPATVRGMIPWQQ